MVNTVDVQKKGKWKSNWGSKVQEIGDQRVCRHLWGVNHFSDFSYGGPKSILVAPGPSPGTQTVLGCDEEVSCDDGLQHPVTMGSSQRSTQVR